MKKTNEGVRDALVDLMVDLEEEKEKAEGEHQDGNSDMVFYGGGAKLDLLKKILPVLRTAIKDLK